jgi:hypothetical protein
MNVYLSPQTRKHKVIFFFPLFIHETYINTAGLSYIYNNKYRVMVFKATFNNISVILWRPVLLMEEKQRTWRKPPCRK